MARRTDRTHRLDRKSGASLRSWAPPSGPAAASMDSDVAVPMGWGRLIFGQTFGSLETLAETLCAERPDERDIAFYLRDPHVLVSIAPDRLFLDPSHTYRLWSHSYRPADRTAKAFAVRRLRSLEDAEAVMRVYAARGMVTCDPAFMVGRHATRLRTYYIAESGEGEIVGTVTGVDHVEAFGDPENGSSLWCLAVDPQVAEPGVGESLVRRLAEHYFARGRDYMDLSVMHDNDSAIRLYEKLGFVRVPVFCVKRRNPINEPLFVPSRSEARLNPYARIITDEARRRGIEVEVLDEQRAFFRLTVGGRRVVCRESLSELTSAIAFCRCDDKRLTRRILADSGLNVPAQQPAGDESAVREFVERHGRVVVKPAHGEQGRGVAVDLRSPQEVAVAVRAAAEVCEEVLVEEYVAGEDLRVIVIGDEVVAGAVRRPPTLTGTGRHTVRELIHKYNRRRSAATGGESRVPLDFETERCVGASGRGLDDVLPEDERLEVRKTANLHTGGTIHDVTARLHEEVRRACLAAAAALEIPVVGLDLLVPEVDGPEHVFIEANERPGLANHEPQPTAERFVDLLFPETATREARP